MFQRDIWKHNGKKLEQLVGTIGNNSWKSIIIMSLSVTGVTHERLITSNSSVIMEENPENSFQAKNNSF